MGLRWSYSILYIQYTPYILTVNCYQYPKMVMEYWIIHFTSSSRYYEFDDIVIREIIGKKLSGRTRKDLDDVAEKTGVLLRSCR